MYDKKSRRRETGEAAGWTAGEFVEGRSEGEVMKDEGERMRV
jgi:hypothetical protein